MATSSSPPSRLLPAPGEVRVRLYGQGVGDCFLLAFPAENVDEDPAYVVIDCGVALGTPQRELRSRAIVEDLHAATGGHLDLLVITHQHFDHISSFQDNWRQWEKIRVDRLYLPWTEATAEKGSISGKKAFEEVLKRAAEAALGKIDADTLENRPGLAAQGDFLGLAPGEKPGNMDEAMEFARNLAGEIRYFTPGEVFRVPRSRSHAYVLGPPLPHQVDAHGRKLIELLEDEEEMYSYADFGLAADRGLVGGSRAFALSEDRALPALASALLAADQLDRDSDEGFSPFPEGRRLDWDTAMDSPFFKAHYGNAERGENGAWRRVDTDWMMGAADLALRAGEFTNNVSLVLAFDLPDSDKMLLFPGDAQVGNWLSWHQIQEWRFTGNTAPENPPGATEKQTLMENLLARVAFYKVSHHGSHNATTKTKGLEKMTRQDLVAYIPVSVPVAQDLMGYCPMPFYPVLRALQQKTAGRVFLPSGKTVAPAEPRKNDEELLAEAGLSLSEQKLPAKIQDGKVLEDEVPLYLELCLPG